MNKFLLVYCFSIFSIINLFPQDTIDYSYFSNLENILKIDPRIKKVKFIEKFDSEGMLRLQVMFVKIKGDKSRRYWRIGKRLEFFKGKLAWSDNVDINSLMSKDTTWVYDCDGNRYLRYIYSNNSEEKFPLKEFDGFSWLFRRFYCYKPEYFRRYIYENNHIEEINFKYVLNKKFVPHGNKTYYNDKWEIQKVIKYIEGIEVEIIR